MWLLISMVASAEEPTPGPQPWRSEWYSAPRLNGRLVSVNGRPTFQAIVGMELGLAYDHAAVLEKGGKRTRDPRDLIGRTRLQGDLLYGLVSQSRGLGARLGSFIGPTSKPLTYQFGPDLWINQYGNSGSLDYYLPLGVGIAVRNQFTFHFDPALTLHAGITPGWVFNGPRARPSIGPFHELSAYAVLNVRAQGLSFNLGFQRQYNAVGVFDSIILSGGL